MQTSRFRQTCPVCGEAGVARVWSLITSVRCSGCGSQLRRPGPSFISFLVGITLEFSFLAALLASVWLQTVLPFLGWVILLVASELAVPLKPNLKDPRTNHRVRNPLT